MQLEITLHQSQEFELQPPERVILKALVLFSHDTTEMLYLMCHNFTNIYVV